MIHGVKGSSGILNIYNTSSFAPLYSKKAASDFVLQCFIQMNIVVIEPSPCNAFTQEFGCET